MSGRGHRNGGCRAQTVVQSDGFDTTPAAGNIARQHHDCHGGEEAGIDLQQHRRISTANHQVSTSYSSFVVHNLLI